MKRGEISMEVIIIAAIALLILVILSFLIINKGGQVDKGTSCRSLGGTCQSECDPQTSQESPLSCEQGEVCCVSLTRDQ